MIQSCYTVRDRKIKSHLFIVLQPTEAGAIRWFRDLMQQKPFAAHPDDYSLWSVGSFDGSTGVLVGVSPVEVVLGVEVTNG